jgi:hypothetical protein
MTNNYQEAARQIVANLGHTRASQLLELMGDPSGFVQFVKKEPKSALEESRLRDAYELIQAMHAAIAKIPWTPDETELMINGAQIAEALRVELDST